MSKQIYTSALSQAYVNKFISEFKHIKINDNKLYYTNGSGDEIEMISETGVIEYSRGCLTNQNFEFDIFQDNNVRKANEAQNAYIACNIATILAHELYHEDLNDVLNGYDFTSFPNIMYK